MTKVRFFVYIGAEVSAVSSIRNDRLHEAVFNLQAVNGKPIATYWKRYVYLNVGLHELN